MTRQIAVKLPDELLAAIDLLVEDGAFDSRSQAVRDGLEAMVARQRRDEIGRRYREAMTVLPESDDEIAETTRLAVVAIEDEPWERWW